MGWKTVRFNTLCLRTVDVGTDTIRSITVPIGNTKYIACFNTETGHELAEARDAISNACDYLFIPNKTTLYISEGCKVPRDLYRNSGHTLVRTPERAKYTVIPTGKPNVQEYSYNVIAYDVHTSSLYICSVTNRGRAISDIDFKSDMFEEVKTKLLGYGDVIFQDRLYNGRIQLLSDRQVYEDILMDTYPDRNYVFELDVPIKYPVQISIDTLNLWERRTDYRMLCDAIVASDWKDYPATLCVFLSTKQQFLHLHANDRMNFVLTQIGYKPRVSYKDCLNGRTIQPKDWNMLQDYIMSKLEIDGPTYIDPKKLSDNSEYLPLIRNKIAVSPMKIDAPMVFNSLQEIVRNS